MRLKSLSLSNFRSFKDATVDFTQGLILVNGENIDTGGSSGSGKTSLVLGLTQAFGFCPFPATEIQNWDQEKPATVEVVLDSEQGEIRIGRGQKTYISVNGVMTKGAVKLVEEKIKAVMGLDPTLLEALTYRGQNQRSMFLSMGDADRKEFLTKVLGLEKFEQAADEALTKAKELQKRHDLLEHQLSTLTGVEEPAKPIFIAANTLEGQIREAEYPHADAVAELRGLRASVGAIKSERELILKDKSAYQPDNKDLILHQNAFEKCQTRLNMLLKAQRDREATALTEIRQTEQMRNQLAREVHEAKTRWIPELAQARAKLQKLEAHTCPTCEQHWLSNENEKTKLLAEIPLLESYIHKGEQAKRVLETLQVGEMPDKDPNIAKFETTLNKIRTAIAQEEAKLQNDADAQFSDKVMEVSQRLEKATHKVMQKQTEVAALNDQVGNLKLELSAIQTENARNQGKYEQKMLEFTQNRSKITDLNAEMSDLAKRLHAEYDFAACVGKDGFLGSVFDEILVEISDAATRTLRAVPNTSHVSLEFASEVTSAKGVSKKTIAPLIRVGNKVAPFRSGLSGGMQTAVELAVDLAVSDVVARRTGTNPGFLILDEAFDGLGPLEREACMEILGNYAQDRTILCIDHSSEMKSMFSNIITVVYENGESRIKQ